MHLEGVFVCFKQNCFQHVCPLKMENTELLRRLKNKISEGNWRFWLQVEIEVHRGALYSLSL